MLCVGMLPDYETVRNTVVKHGSSQWYEIAVKLGLNNNKIREETHNKATDGGKLTAVIEAKREQVGKMETVKESLRACHRIHTPIDREVEDELEKKGAVLCECYASGLTLTDSLVSLLRERMLAVTMADVNITAAKLFRFLPQNVHLVSR